MRGPGQVGPVRPLGPGQMMFTGQGASSPGGRMSPLSPMSQSFPGPRPGHQEPFIELTNQQVTVTG